MAKRKIPTPVSLYTAFRNSNLFVSILLWTQEPVLFARTAIFFASDKSTRYARSDKAHLGCDFLRSEIRDNENHEILAEK